MTLGFGSLVDFDVSAARLSEALAPDELISIMLKDEAVNATIQGDNIPHRSPDVKGGLAPLSAVKAGILDLDRLRRVRVELSARRGFAWRRGRLFGFV
jgi:hypothetical protein